MKSTICFKNWLLNDSRTIGSSRSDFAMTCIDLIENVNINNITPSLGYMYSLRCSDVDLCPKRKDLHAKYTEEHKKEIQVDLAFNIINMIHLLAEPFTLQYSDSVIMTIPLSTDIANMIRRFCPKKISQVNDVYGDLKALSIILWNRAVNTVDVPINDKRKNSTRMYPNTTERLGVTTIINTFLPMLELRTYDPEEPEDIRALLLYCDAHHLQKITTVLKIMYRLFDETNYLKEATCANRMFCSSQIEFIQSIPVRTPEAVIGITDNRYKCDCNHVIEMTNPFNYNVVDNYLALLKSSY